MHTDDGLILPYYLQTLHRSLHRSLYHHLYHRAGDVIYREICIRAVGLYKGTSYEVSAGKILKILTKSKLQNHAKTLYIALLINLQFNSQQSFLN